MTVETEAQVDQRMAEQLVTAGQADGEQRNDDQNMRHEPPEHAPSRFCADHADLHPRDPGFIGVPICAALIRANDVVRIHPIAPLLRGRSHQFLLWP